MPKIGIINYGVGNLQSVKNSLAHLGIESELIEKPEELHNFERIILPGVGAFGAAMEKLNSLGFVNAIKKYAESGKPILGICLGMQLLFDESHEHGRHKGLGLIKGKVLPFSEKVKDLPLPLIGWNNAVKEKDSPIVANLDNNPSFYFVHGFYCELEEKESAIANSEYGITFPAIVNKNNIYGCQFHPEKSQKDGLKILKNFSQI